MRRNSSLYKQRPRAFHDERVDCCVRALGLVAGVGYAVAHAVLAAHGRQNARRTPWGVLTRACATFKLGRVYTVLEGPGGTQEVKPPTLAQFVREHKTGRYLVCSRGHAAALIDGTLHDWRGGLKARHRIVRFYRLTSADNRE